MAKNSMTQAEMAVEIERLKAQIADSKKPRPITFKVSEKGAVSVYGLQRFPVTLYGEQWARLLSQSTDLQAFISTNAAKLATKS
ncbi:MAG: hypothetical protein L0Y56_00705 [Nitrospira sp.]|nr:hypothetical protein [Nitrospira sp.]